MSRAYFEQVIQDSLIDNAEAIIRENGLYPGEERAVAERIVSDPDFEHPEILQPAQICGCGYCMQEPFCICGHVHRKPS